MVGRHSDGRQALGWRRISVTPLVEDDGMAHFVISCDSCVMDGTAACADCVVTHLLAPARRELLAFSDDELRAVELLAAAGLVPTLRHREAD
jgi:hypothetical protein